MLRRFLTASLTMLALGAPMAALAAPAVTLTSAAAVTADERLVWNIPYLIRNTGAVGFYADSFLADFTDEDAGVHRGPRRWTESLTALLSTIPPISGNDSLESTCFLPSRFEKGKVTLRIFGHTPAGPLPPLTATLRTEPGETSAAHPSQLLDVGGRKVEVVAFAPANPEGQAPGVLIVHSDDEHARRWLQVGTSMRARGYAVVVVSLPGFGASTGPADLNGPATSAALDAAFERLASLPGVNPGLLAVWGTGRGATAAALLAGRRTGVAAMVLQSGSYDLWAAYRAADAKGRKAIEAEAGRDSLGWSQRSPLSSNAHIHCPVLLLHGELDRIAPAASAHAYVATLQGLHAAVDARFQPDRGHDLPVTFTRSSAMQFFKKVFGY
ncbi:MAG: prolyl oligopeptidase family serine peptidase [Candidatus Eisenbacteria bacterium]|nr:prolyl oligopeptidase family serine peptidase [Candidatus Eisenbacteria bacterium]